MAAKAKRVNYQLIRRDDQPEMFDLLKDLIERHHEHLTNARIALAWHKALKPDADGKLVLGRAKKASDLDRELAPFDFVIILNREFWLEDRTKPEQRRALMDHELCHCEVELDDNDEPKRDEKDRVVYRLRKHDIEEFTAIVQRHGIWKGDLEKFAKALAKSRPQINMFDGPGDPQ